MEMINRKEKRNSRGEENTVSEMELVELNRRKDQQTLVISR